MECKLPPIVMYEVADQHRWWNHLSSCVPLNDSKEQQLAAMILTILKSCFVASFPDEVDPISVSEICFSIMLESDFELLSNEFPMNCTICLSLSRECSCRTSLLTNVETWVPTCIRNCVHWRVGPPKLFDEKECSLLTIHLANALYLDLVQILEQLLQQDFVILCQVTHPRSDLSLRM